jgi:NADH-quinone oxidoreductase subunit H
LRIDQVMMTCLKYLLPISCVLLLGVSVWQVVVPPTFAAIFRFVLAGGVMAVVLLTAIKLVTTPSKLPTPSVPVWGRQFEMTNKG